MASRRAMKIDAMLRHLAAGGDIGDFAGTKYENLALVRTAVRRGLISWDGEGNRYTLTPVGRRGGRARGVWGAALDSEPGNRACDRRRRASFSVAAGRQMAGFGPGDRLARRG